MSENNTEALARLNRTILARVRSDPETSYTAKLLDKGPNKIGGKTAEETAEFAMALVSENDNDVANEAADVIYHLLVGLASRGVDLVKVMNELDRRANKSGLAVQAERKAEAAITKQDREEGDKLLIDFNKRGGLVPAIAQDVETGEVLMLAYIDKTAFQMTLDKRQAVYFSTSRNEIWHKGATSGQFQEVVQILTDCDQDALLFKVKQRGNGACHTGRNSCFYREVFDEGNGVWVLKPAQGYQ